MSPSVTATGFEARPRADPIGARIVEGAIRATPMRRVARPEEIAGAVVFLCSPAAAFITGQVLSVNGGVAMWARPVERQGQRRVRSRPPTSSRNGGYSSRISAA